MFHIPSISLGGNTCSWMEQESMSCRVCNSIMFECEGILKINYMPLPILSVLMEAREGTCGLQSQTSHSWATQAQGEADMTGQLWELCLGINCIACIWWLFCSAESCALPVFPKQNRSTGKKEPSIASSHSCHAPTGQPAPAAARAPALCQAGQTEPCPVPRPARTAASGCQHHLTCWLLRAASRCERKREEANSRQVRGRRTLDELWPFPQTHGTRTCPKLPIDNLLQNSSNLVIFLGSLGTLSLAWDVAVMDFCQLGSGTSNLCCL